MQIIVICHYDSIYFEVSEVSLMLRIRMDYHTSDKSSGGFLWTLEKQLQTESDNYAKNGD